MTHSFQSGRVLVNNQPTAAMHNYHTLVRSALPIFKMSSDSSQELAQGLVKQGVEKIAKASMDTFRVKMGLPANLAKESMAL